MKKIGKTLLWIVVGFIIIVDIALTVYLLNYNQYNVAEFGDKSVLIMNKKLADYQDGDLLLVKKTENKEIKAGDNIFYYDTTSLENLINYGRIIKVNDNPNGDNTFIMENSDILGYDTVIGADKDVKVYSGWGKIIGTLSSRWVFLFVIIVPILVLFLYQLYLLVQELKDYKKIDKVKN